MNLSRKPANHQVWVPTLPPPVITEQQVTSAEVTNRQKSTLSADSLPETGVIKKPIHSDTSKSTPMNNDAPLHDVATYTS